MWTFMVIVGSAFLVLSGALCLYTRDIAWDLISVGLEKLRFEPKRSRVWNALITLYGILTLLIGLFTFYQLIRGS
jgi:hypothetical protein